MGLDFRVLLIAAAAAVVGYYAHMRAGVLSAVVVLFTAAWLMYRFSSADKALSTLGILLNPLFTTLAFFLLGFSYSAIEGNHIIVSTLLGLAAAFFGTAFSQLVFKYWNIGE